MSDPTILVTIGPTGEVTVTVDGVAGPGCQALTRPLESALGVTREDTRTADYYRAAAPSARHVRLDSA
jgi:cytidylate kinase